MWAAKALVRLPKCAEGLFEPNEHITSEQPDTILLCPIKVNMMFGVVFSNTYFTSKWAEEELMVLFQGIMFKGR